MGQAAVSLCSGVFGELLLTLLWLTQEVLLLLQNSSTWRLLPNVPENPVAQLEVPFFLGQHKPLNDKWEAALGIAIGLVVSLTAAAHKKSCSLTYVMHDVFKKAKGWWRNVGGI